MNFHSVADLNSSIISNLHKIPHDIDLVVGIPRSGLLAANLIALYLNTQLADLDGFLEGRLLYTGSHRLNNDIHNIKDCRKIMVIDDSILFGSQMKKARERIGTLHLPQKIIYAAVYASPGVVDKVDIFFEICHQPRAFEWNVMHHRQCLKKACVDIDGVICRDPTPEENDDGVRYAKFLETCEPIFLPSVTVGCLVTCRLEKYRKQTEKWLQRHGVRYEKLIMMDLPNKAARVTAGHGIYKAKVYMNTDAELFIESSLRQAIVIANKSCKPVLCMTTREIILPSFGNIGKKIIQTWPKASKKGLKLLTSRIKRALCRLF